MNVSTQSTFQNNRHKHTADLLLFFLNINCPLHFVSYHGESVLFWGAPAKQESSLENGSKFRNPFVSIDRRVFSPFGKLHAIRRNRSWRKDDVQQKLEDEKEEIDDILKGRYFFLFSITVQSPADSLNEEENERDNNTVSAGHKNKWNLVGKSRRLMAPKVTSQNVRLHASFNSES